MCFSTTAMVEGFSSRIAAAWPELSGDASDKIVRYWKIVRSENKVQNLTRLIDDDEFVEGHLLDVKSLLQCGLIEFGALDLGSGCGVPGLLSAICGQGEWVLTESESKKAEFLKRAVMDLGLDGRVSVFSGRAEAYLQGSQVRSVVSRAVGTVERIFSWIGKCSTWNNLILFKGPGWESEWAQFTKSKFSRLLKIESLVEYEVGSEKKTRKIVKLKRVPRGT